MYERASAEVLAERARIAERVCGELMAAGLPITSNDGSTDCDHGALVIADDRVSGAVIVEWICHPLLLARLVQAPLTNPGSDPVVGHHGRVKEAMNAAITAILTSAGFAVVANPDDMDPLTLKIAQAPESQTPTTWEQPQPAPSGISES